MPRAGHLASSGVVSGIVGPGPDGAVLARTGSMGDKERVSADRVPPARSFDRTAIEYDRGRPGWPHAAIDLLDLDPASSVVDLGAGTGKLTSVLCDRFSGRVWAIEPLDAMRGLIAHTAPRAEALAGTAEAIPLADDGADAVFAGQAFHWFELDRAVAEIARVLRPGGTVALLWNRPDPDRPSPLPAAYRARFDELRHEVRLPEVDARAAVEGGPFGPMSEATVANEQVSSRADVLAFAVSQSWIACRPAGERERLLAELGELLPNRCYRFPLVTDVLWAIPAK